MSLSRYSAVTRLLIAVGLFAIFLVAVHRFLAPGETLTQPGQEVEAPGTKVFVLVVDGMRPEDAMDERVTFLEPFRREGFLGRVEPCMECLTVPCVNEAFTGTATAGLLGAYNNLVATSEVTTPSLFSDLKAAGRTSAIAHLGQYKGFSSALAAQTTDRNAWPSLEAWIAQGIDLIVWHYPKLDEAAHHHKPESPKYGDALRALDAEGQKLRAALPPGYRLVVVGDHGHTRDGRHILGLDIPTMFLTDSATFGRGVLPGRSPLSTFRYLVGAPLGFLPPDRYDGLNLGFRLSEGSAMKAAADARTFIGPRKDVSPLAVVLSAAALAAFAVWNLPVRRGLVTVGLLGSAILGVTYLQILPVIHYSKTLPEFRGKLWVAVLAVGAIGWLLRRDARVFLATIALLLLALPATLYNYGVFQQLPNALAAVALTVGLSRWRVARERGWVVPVALVLLGWYALRTPHVGTFKLDFFTEIHRQKPESAIVAWAALAALFAPPGWSRLVAAALAAVGASGRVIPEGLPLAGVTVAVVAVTIWAPRWLPAVAAFGVIPWYKVEWAVGTAALAGFATGFAWLAARSPYRRWLIPVATTLFAWLGLAMSARLRASGLDFSFAVSWFAEDQHLRFWPVIAVAMMVKALVPSALVIVGVREVAGTRFDLAWPMRVVLLRWSATAAAIAGLLVSRADPPRYRLLEQIEDAISWAIVLLAFALLARRAAARYGSSAAVAATSSAK